MSHEPDCVVYDQWSNNMLEFGTREECEEFLADLSAIDPIARERCEVRCAARATHQETTP